MFSAGLPIGQNCGDDITKVKLSAAFMVVGGVVGVIK